MKSDDTMERRHRVKRRGNIRRIRQRNRRVALFVVVMCVAAAGIFHVVRARQQDEAEQAYAEQMAEQENQAAREKDSQYVMARSLPRRTPWVEHPAKSWAVFRMFL